MKNINEFAGLAIGVYLLAVVYNGNAQPLINFLATQKEFTKWAVALAILSFIADEYKNSVASGFVYIAVVAMLITAAGNGSLKTGLDQINQLLGVAK